jgi:hypothetical protein
LAARTCCAPTCAQFDDSIRRINLTDNSTINSTSQLDCSIRLFNPNINSTIQVDCSIRTLIRLFNSPIQIDCSIRLFNSTIQFDNSIRLFNSTTQSRTCSSPTFAVQTSIKING